MMKSPLLIPIQQPVQSFAINDLRFGWQKPEPQEPNILW
jgi:hypothetical protein